MKYNLSSGHFSGQGRYRLCAAVLFLFFALSVLVIYAGDILPFSFIKNVKRTVQRFQKTSGTPISSAEELISHKNMEYIQKVILDTKRVKNVKPFKTFKFTEKKVGISELTPETNGNPVRSVILSTWRSGSSFFGDILNSLAGTYYHFEPLMFLHDVQIRENSTDAIDEMHQLLKCNYSSKTYLKRAMFKFNNRMWEYCDAFAPFRLCENRDFLNKFCKIFPFQALKEVRLRPAVCEPLLLDRELNVKIVLLIRDPRAVFSSRKRSKWCLKNGVDCGDLPSMCKDMVSDFKAAQYLTEKYPDRFKVIRYEDLILNPFIMTSRILKFYGLPFHRSVHFFLKQHTKFNGGNIMSTYRNSTKTSVFSWRRSMTLNEIDHIQARCTEAMNLWGYKHILRVKDQKSEEFTPISESPFPCEW